MQDRANIGPLPAGLYAFGKMIQSHPHLGPFVLPLLPDSSNKMFGRSDFYMHGDTPQTGCASEGCIIMPRNVRLECAQSEDKRLQVIAKVENEDLA